MFYENVVLTETKIENRTHKWFKPKINKKVKTDILFINQCVNNKYAI